MESEEGTEFIRTSEGMAERLGRIALELHRESMDSWWRSPAEDLELTVQVLSCVAPEYNGEIASMLVAHADDMEAVDAGIEFAVRAILMANEGTGPRHAGMVGAKITDDFTNRKGCRRSIVERARSVPSFDDQNH